MIHLAVGLLAISLTCAVLALAAAAFPAVPDVSSTFALGSVVAVVVSGALLWYVRRERL